MKAGSNPYTVVGTPKKNSGVRFLEFEETVDLLNSKEKVFDANGNFLGLRGELLKDAFDRIEKADFNGKPSGVKMLIRKQLTEDRATKLRYDSNKLAIDLAMKKGK